MSFKKCGFFNNCYGRAAVCGPVGKHVKTRGQLQPEFRFSGGIDFNLLKNRISQTKMNILYKFSSLQCLHRLHVLIFITSLFIISDFTGESAEMSKDFCLDSDPQASFCSDMEQQCTFWTAQSPFPQCSKRASKII